MRKLRFLTNSMLKNEHTIVLRELGRVIGVKAPASLKKNQLITEILNIQNGIVLPIEPNGRGAPTKIKADISKYYVDYSKHYADDEEVDTKFRFCDSNPQKESFIIEGILDINPTGYGFLRVKNFEISQGDVYVPITNIKSLKLRKGDKIKGIAKFGKEGDSASLHEIHEINGISLEQSLNREHFDNLTPCYPTEKIKLETEESVNDVAIRFIDLFCPIGKGQRGLIVAPPKTGKTTLIKKIAKSIEANYPEIELIILLIDERPEEVTDIKRSVSGEVVYSTFDEEVKHHVKAAEFVINRAKRLVEVGKDVVILIDSITRLTRAYNNVIESSGKTLTGGLEPSAMQEPKKFFGAARNIENGGSLTILSTALIDTGSKMDDVIYEEFKGTGNMEIFLSRELSEKRIFPAIDLYKSGTRKEELLLSDSELNAVYKLRKMLSSNANATDGIIEMLKKSKNNADFVNKLDVWIKLYEK